MSKTRPPTLIGLDNFHSTGGLSEDNMINEYESCNQSTYTHITTPKPKTAHWATIAVVISLTACQPGAMDTLDGSETDSTTVNENTVGAETSGGWEPDKVWDGLFCTEVAGMPICRARPTGADDAWVIVVRDCYLDQFPDAGGFSLDSCLPGEIPSVGMPEARCVDVGEVACFVGGDGWFTPVAPWCDAEVGNVAPWAPSKCGGTAGPIGDHPWDEVGCALDVEETACTGVLGNSAFSLTPECKLAEWDEVAPPECEDPGDGDGDPGCGGALGCPCDTGGCIGGLVCTLGEVCHDCPDGWLSCPCTTEGTCEGGSCRQGVDSDGSPWSICWQADLIPCSTDLPCPGDAYCNDDAECVWLD